MFNNIDLPKNLQSTVIKWFAVSVILFVVALLIVVAQMYVMDGLQSAWQTLADNGEVMELPPSQLFSIYALGNIVGGSTVLLVVLTFQVCVGILKFFTLHENYTKNHERLE